MEAEKRLAELEWYLHRHERHPDYEYATREGPRKSFDLEDNPPDEPPTDGGEWERNWAAGRYGWERFDYTEESYWMARLKVSPVAKEVEDAREAKKKFQAHITIPGEPAPRKLNPA